MKLVLHIGMGKTGTSSIQAALDHATDKLAENRAKYLGHMLEHAAGGKKYDWQLPAGAGAFFDQMDVTQAAEELQHVLLSEIEAASKDGIETLIWSNESILGRRDRVFPALQAATVRGVDIEIAAYVRRHDKWAVSAYLQWGIQHKNYPGPVKSFKTWAAERNFNFSEDFLKWNEDFENEINLFNYDAIDDVAQHFLSWVGIPGQASLRTNVTPAPETLAAWAVFNNRFKAPILPNRFSQLLRRVQQSNHNGERLPDFKQLLPSEEDIIEIRHRTENDRDRINEMLVRSGQPPLETDGPVTLPRAPSDWQMQRLMMETIFNLHDRVSELERRLKALEESS